ncbi:hypothetical protein [Aromatoleum diolicum]|uniref:Uncharacterized protein n=1 Tax=Aromatoleum diolicum TaxID=75796 RepID=A0ABX1Q7H2_9RHOO|nr:hypothetical protein [Aromatoleum diolicum]NMG73366.1 hypothetical protein [Aromatoleum diolicum]
MLPRIDGLGRRTPRASTVSSVLHGHAAVAHRSNEFLMQGREMRQNPLSSWLITQPSCKFVTMRGNDLIQDTN